MKNKIYKKIGIITNLILYLSVFISSLYMPSDPDLGWHLKYGDYFFRTGVVLRNNPFSQLMPTYKWDNSSWLTDLIAYQIFHNFNFIGLSILSALIVMATFYFMAKSAKLSLFEKAITFPLVLYFVSALNEISFRGQLLSLLFLSILYFILSKYESNKKNVLFLIPLFLVWGNLHGEYLLGLGVLSIWFLVYIVKEIVLDYKTKIKKLLADTKYLFLSIIGSFLAVLINPFGIGVYQEPLRHFSDPMQKSIIEFLAPTDFSVVWWHLLFCGLVLTLGIMLLGTGRKNWDKTPFYAPSLVLFALTFWVKRYAWVFYYSAFFLFQPVAHFFEPEEEKQKKYASLVISILFLGLIILLKYPFSDFKNMNWDYYCSLTTHCSPKASEFVITHNLNNDKLLTTYDYGGYLIWNYPQIKPTIDGRMHLWRDEKGFSAFEYYYAIEQDTTNDIEVAPYNFVLTSRRKPIYGRLLQLSSEGKWKHVFQDNNAAVFIRINTP